MNTGVALGHFMLDKEGQEKWGCWRLEWLLRYCLQSSWNRGAWDKLMMLTRIHELKTSKRRILPLWVFFLVILNPFVDGIKWNFCYLVFFKLIVLYLYGIINLGPNPSGNGMGFIPRLLLLWVKKGSLVLKTPSSVRRL